MEKTLLSIIAILLTFYAYYPYIKSINNGQTKPHIFSWVIWGIVTVIAAAAQYAANGGVGSWPTLASGLVTLYVALLAYLKRADITITPSDKFFFILGLLAIPVWYVTNDPLWAIILLTTADTLGFIPTFRKSYYFPYQENLEMYVIVTIRNIIAIFALEEYSLTTIYFPAVTALFCVLFIAMVMWRRNSRSGAA